jgi:Uncharacterised protein family (UPF0167)
MNERLEAWKQRYRENEIAEGRRPEAFFADLGIPFPLFEAPIAETHDYHGPGQCSRCGADDPHCFMHRTGRNPVQLGCYSCLRAAHFPFVKDSVLGLITPEGAALGITGGIPRLARDEFELVAVAGSEMDWVYAKVPTEDLFEILRTPDYRTWQGEQWQFCCRRPMVYIGVWKRSDFEWFAQGGEAEALFYECVGEDEHRSWDWIAEMGGPYMFRCKKCGSYRGHHDND